MFIYIHLYLPSSFIGLLISASHTFSLHSHQQLLVSISLLVRPRVEPVRVCSQDVVHLPHRPPLHCTGLCVLIFGALLWCSRFYPGMALLPYQWLLAFSTHHLRDAIRRGLWLVPGLWTTRAVPYGVYLALEVAAAPLVALLMPPDATPVSVFTLKDAMLV